MDVSIIIVNFNTKDLLRDCLNSIFHQAGDVDYRVIVVDNASIDGSPEMVKNEFPHVALIENSTNRGYAAACNQGMKVADGRYILLLNSDVLICDSAVEKTVRYADSHSQVGIVGCQVWESEDKIMMTCFRFPGITNLLLSTSGLSRLFKHNRLLGREKMQWWQRDSECQVDVVPGVFMLVRREAVEQVGLMDENYFFYSEEVDWCYRFSKAGWKTMFWPGARIIHIGGGAQSSKKTPEKSYVLLVKGKLIFFKKNRGFTSYLLARAIYLVQFVLKYCLWTAISITSLKRGANSEFRMQKRKALCALKFTAFGIEPGKSRAKFISFLLKKTINFVKFTIALAYSVYLSFVHRQGRRVIICYHGINKADVTGFMKQMAYIARKCHVVKPSMIKDAQMDGGKVLLAITFDDAFVSVRENALPVLKKYGLSAGVFVTTGCLGKPPNWPMADDCPDRDDIVMSEQQVKELDGDGFEILSHTISHSALTRVDDDRLQEELVDSQRELRRMIDREIVGISYPYGEYDSRVCDAARRAGYKFGFTVEPQMVNHSIDNLSIGRFSVSPKDGLFKFRLKVHGSYQAERYLRGLKRLFVRKSAATGV
jgi:GT2 family glycosyltransferase/peptidoglycan/xylan/chitin deacetylase (PgdA/CDA1 family)